MKIQKCKCGFTFVYPGRDKCGACYYNLHEAMQKAGWPNEKVPNYGEL